MSETHNTARGTRSRLATVFLSGVIGVAAIGYLIGINAGVPQPDRRPPDATHPPRQDAAEQVVPATSYAEMRNVGLGPAQRGETSLKQLPQPEFDLFAEVEPDPQAKEESLRQRSATRAFNGAPPVVPHAVDQTNDAACYACHGTGMWVADRIARRMSHPFLANCLQCHAPPPPVALAEEQTPANNGFVGAAAPTSGGRAYPGAPPTIPHTTWMRSECLSCHGRPTGWAGLESTHPWRAACQQCHAPSAVLDQAVASEVSFLQPPQVNAP